MNKILSTVNFKVIKMFSCWKNLFSTTKKEELLPKEILSAKVEKSEKKVFCNRIAIKISGPHQKNQDDFFSCEIDAIFMQGIINDNGSGYSNYKEQTYWNSITPKSEYLENQCDFYRKTMAEYLNENDCPIDLTIYIVHQDHDPIKINEKLISHEKFWERYNSAIDSLLNFRNNLNNSLRLK